MGDCGEDQNHCDYALGHINMLMSRNVKLFCVVELEGNYHCHHAIYILVNRPTRGMYFLYQMVMGLLRKVMADQSHSDQSMLCSAFFLGVTELSTSQFYPARYGIWTLLQSNDKQAY
jgi:hypothetical protein